MREECKKDIEYHERGMQKRYREDIQKRKVPKKHQMLQTWAQEAL